jgi:acyl-CoA synthetase (AMP-forming)/AMP-acid ligase II
VTATFTGPGEFLRIHARHRGDAIALVDAGLDRTLTFGELDTRVNQLAHALFARGLGAGDRIAVLATDSHQFLETILACTRTGITYVALNVRLLGTELETLVGRAAPRLVFVAERYVDIAQRLRPLVGRPGEVVVYGRGETSTYEAFIDAADDTDPGTTVDPEATISLAFTSGTTGLPKGVCQPLRMLANSAVGGIIDYEIADDDVRYAAAPMFHIAGVAYPLMNLARGVPSWLLPQFDPETVLGWLRGDRLTAAFLVPTMISTLLQLPGVRDTAYERLRSLVYGAAPMPPSLLRRAMDVFRCEFVQAFGAGTEAGTQCILSSADHRRAAAGAAHLLGSIGRPGFGVELRVVDDDLRDVPVGEVGEIATRSAHMMTGYLDMPDETAEAFRGGWFRAGDLGRLDDEGYVYLAGRTKDMIVRGGENIFPIEVESVVMEHPGVADVAVVGRPDEHWSEVVHAFVVRGDAEVSEPELRELCRAELASYKVPVAFHFVDELPKNAAGKVLKRLLREDDAQPSSAEPPLTSG